MQKDFNLKNGMNIQFFADLTTDPETNLITKSQMARVREVDFVERFSHNILNKLREALGVTRVIPMTEGTTMYVYKTTGTLQDGSVPEGEVIPLSQYERTKTPVGEITLSKWRKAVSAEAIMKSGRDEAVQMTDNKLLSDVQKKIRGDFFSYITGLDGSVIARSTLQGVLAQTWAKLQVLFEDDSIEAVHFMNPVTIADYLETATISTQTAFGMTYIANFLGMGTVILSSAIPVGQVYSTAKENIVMYYVSVNGEALSSFDLTADETGYIGISSGYANKERAQVESLVMSGIQFFVEYAAGVVKGVISGVLPQITVASVAGTDVGDTKITTDYTLGTSESFVYKVTDDPIVVKKGDSTSSWTSWNGSADITAATGKIITVAVSKSSAVIAAGNATVTAKAGA